MEHLRDHGDHASSGVFHSHGKAGHGAGVASAIDKRVLAIAEETAELFSGFEVDRLYAVAG
jgi:hypothetical protein